MSGPFLVTPRLELWQPVAGDMLAMYEVVSNPQTARFLGGPITLTDHHARFMRNAGSWLLYGYGGLMLRERGQSTVIGNIGVFHSRRGIDPRFDDMPEAGWIVGADHVGKGYGEEAMRAVLDWFDARHGPRPIFAIVDADNAPSIRLGRRLGFEPRGTGTMPEGPDVNLYERPA